MDKIEATLETLTSLMSSLVTQNQVTQFKAPSIQQIHPGVASHSKATTDPKSVTRKRSLAFFGDNDGEYLVCLFSNVISILESVS